MEYIIFLIKNLFNQKNSPSYSLAFETSLGFSIDEKKLDSIFMFAQENQNLSEPSQDDYVMEIDDSQAQKGSIFDRLKSMFNKPKALPNPNKEYTMDDWMKAQKNPISRMFTNIMESATHMIQGAFSKAQAKKMEGINTPTTPSQNFVQAVSDEKATNTFDKPYNIIIPKSAITGKASTKEVSTPSRPFSPLTVEEIETGDLEEIKINNNDKETKPKDVADDLETR